MEQNDKITLQFTRSEVNLFLLWILAALVGRVLFMIFEPTTATLLWLVPILSGVVRGIPQGWVVRKDIDSGLLWGLATFIGYTLSGVLVNFSGPWISNVLGTITVDDTLGFTLVIFAIQAAQGVVVGLLQWLVLRRSVKQAGWWIAAAALGNVLAVWANIGLIPMAAQMAANTGQEPIAFNVTRVILIAFIHAFVTGTALIWLLRDRKVENLTSDE